MQLAMLPRVRRYSRPRCHLHCRHRLAAAFRGSPPRAEAEAPVAAAAEAVEVPEKAAVGSPETGTDIDICVLLCMTRAPARRRARTTHCIA